MVLLSDCLPGEWYFVVTCPNCKTRQALFKDPSKGKARVRQTYTHRCDTCGVLVSHEPEDIERWECK